MMSIKEALEILDTMGKIPVEIMEYEDHAALMEMAVECAQKMKPLMSKYANLLTESTTSLFGTGWLEFPK